MSKRQYICELLLIGKTPQQVGAKVVETFGGKLPKAIEMVYSYASDLRFFYAVLQGHNHIPKDEALKLWSDVAAPAPAAA